LKLDLHRGLKFGAANIDRLSGAADQVDFYTALRFVEKGAVLKLFEVEISVQVAIDADQQVPAEGRGQA